jgi:hypothetical protein
MLIGLGLAACGDSNDSMAGNGGNMQSDQNTVTCEAATHVATFNYVVQDDTLELSSSTAQSIELHRDGLAGQGTKPVFGTWLLPITTAPIRSTLDIEAGQVTVAAKCSFFGASKTATVSARAQVTDSTISILEEKKDDEMLVVR